MATKRRRLTHDLFYLMEVVGVYFCKHLKFLVTSDIEFLFDQCNDFCHHLGFLLLAGGFSLGGGIIVFNHSLKLNN